MGFALSFEERRALGYKLVDRLNDYFASLSDRPVQPPLESRTAPLAARPLPEHGENPDAVLDELFRELIDNGFHTAAANYFGLQNPTPTYMSVLAEALVAAFNPQLASFVHSARASRLEQETVRWVGERVGWNKPFDGTFTSGGSEANFTALALALARHFPAAVAQGLAAVDRHPVFYATAEAHHSLDKSAGLLGLGREALRRIPVTSRLELDIAQLEARIAADIAADQTPFCVVATAGTTSSGAVDDIAALAEICARRRLWLHVDGAYGGAVIFSDRHRHLVKGIERADSVTIDPHKWLATSMSAGMILTAHPELLWRVFAAANPFMPKIRDAGGVDHFNIGLQWSRRMNSLKLWLTLRVHGRGAYEELIDRQIGLAHGFAEWIGRSDDFDLFAPPPLAGVNFRVRRPGASEDQIRAANEAVVQRVTRDGRRWISAATVAGKSVIRMLVISYLSEERHVEALKAALSAAAADVRADFHRAETRVAARRAPVPAPEIAVAAHARVRNPG
jgi:aromatic-L-amino-acid decarboxylase